MIIIGASVLTLGIILLVIPVTAAELSLAGFVIIGLGCAPIYPSIIHSTPANFGAENSGAIIGIQMACAYVGSTFMPPLFNARYDGIDLPHRQETRSRRSDPLTAVLRVSAHRARKADDSAMSNTGGVERGRLFLSGTCAASAGRRWCRAKSGAEVYFF